LITGYPILFVGEYDAAARSDVFVDRVWVDESIGKTSRTRPEIGILYSLYVIPRFSIRRYSVSPVNGPLSRIVRRQSQIEGAIIAFLQPLHILKPGISVWLRPAYVASPTSLCRSKSRLHQSASCLTGIRLRTDRRKPAD